MTTRVHLLAGRDINELHVHLFELAGEAARQALIPASRSRGFSAVQTAFATGAAAEWLLRALVASVSPVLLAQGGAGGRDTAIALAGGRPVLDEQVELDPSELRTVMTNDLKQLIFALFPSLRATPIASRLEVIFSVRNTAVHLGLASAADNHRALQTLTLLTPDLVPPLGLTEIDFWGSAGIEQARELRSEVLSAVEYRVKTLIDRAQAYYSGAYGHLDRRALSTVRRQLSRTSQGFGHVEGAELFVTGCPSCRSAGWLQFWPEPPLSTRDVRTVERRSMIYLHPSEFRCAVCRLVLDAEGIAMSGVEVGDEVEDYSEELL